MCLLTLQVLTDALVFRHDLRWSIDHGRLHLLPPPTSEAPPSIALESAYDSESALDPATLDQFARSPDLDVTASFPLPYTTVNGVDKSGDTVLAVGDSRSGDQAGETRDLQRQRETSRLQQ